MWYSSARYTVERHRGTAYFDQTEFVVTFLLSSVRVDCVAQRICVGSRVGHSHSDRTAQLFSVMLDTVARTPQSHEHVLVVSCIEASWLLSTLFPLSGSGAKLVRVGFRLVENSAEARQ